MKLIFANESPVEYRYDDEADVLYIKFAQDEVIRTIELLKEWPLLLVDINAQDQIIGIEYVGAKQFGADTFTKLLHERVRREFGIELASPDSFGSYLRTPEAEMAFSK
jgi:uncharacterized protein YuzE